MDIEKVDAATKAQMEALQDTDDAVLVCVWKEKGDRHFPDDMEGTCFDCANPIIFRPHAAKIAKKVCFPCAVHRMEGGHA